MPCISSSHYLSITTLQVRLRPKAHSKYNRMPSTSTSNNIDDHNQGRYRLAAGTSSTRDHADSFFPPSGPEQTHPATPPPGQGKITIEEYRARNCNRARPSTPPPPPRRRRCGGAQRLRSLRRELYRLIYLTTDPRTCDLYMAQLKALENLRKLPPKQK